MPRLTIAILILGFSLLTAGHADETTTESCDHGYEKCLTRWQDDRLKFLKSAAGYLNLAGLYWLNEGDNTFGSGPGNDIIFPAKAEASIGVFDLHDDAVQMSVKPGMEVHHLNRAVQRIVMAGDSVQEPVIVRQGSYAWNVIDRDGKFAVRLRDFENPVLLNFPPIVYFPINTSQRVSAKLWRYDEPRVIRVDTVIEGLHYNPWSPGVVEFEIDSQTFDLEAYDAGDELFFVFGDLTTGRETYPAGRFLYAKKPDSNGLMELDFNRAHSPPCAYNDFATCPVAAARNRIAVRIEAGERYERGAH